MYKKELNLNGGQNNYLQSYGNDLESARAENYDCVCVPYDQCPSHEIIGRKDDFFLPLDPRNLKSDIQAEEERVITDGNGTMSVVKVAKGAELNVTAIEEEKKENDKAEEVKKISKREAPVEAEKKQDKEGEPEAVSNI